VSHRQRLRAEDRVRAARAIGLRNLPLHGTAEEVWPEIVPDLLALVGKPRLLREWEQHHSYRRPTAARPLQTSRAVDPDPGVIDHRQQHTDRSDVRVGSLPRPVSSTMHRLGKYTPGVQDC
jgi:hypothetical protein